MCVHGVSGALSIAFGRGVPSRLCVPRLFSARTADRSVAQIGGEVKVWQRPYQIALVALRRMVIFSRVFDPFVAALLAPGGLLTTLSGVAAPLLLGFASPSLRLANYDGSCYTHRCEWLRWRQIGRSRRPESPGKVEAGYVSADRISLRSWQPKGLGRVGLPGSKMRRSRAKMRHSRVVLRYQDALIGAALWRNSRRRESGRIRQVGWYRGRCCLALVP